MRDANVIKERIESVADGFFAGRPDDYSDLGQLPENVVAPVASAEVVYELHLGKNVNLSAMAISLGLDDVCYDPDAFAGLFYIVGAGSPEENDVIVMFGDGRGFCFGNSGHAEANIDGFVAKIRDSYISSETEIEVVDAQNVENGRRHQNSGERNKIPDTGDEDDYANVSIRYDELSDEKVIGSGGNAEVVRATLSDSGLTVAIKKPHTAGTLYGDKITRFLEEAERWDKLDDHEHIVAIIDYGSEPLPWIAMEYMDGGHLGHRSGEQEFPQALWTALAVTKGVRHAHRRGVAHLDLKPENILFRTVATAWDVPKVADWGLSKLLLDHSQSVEGLSPQYAAPEQFSDEYGPTDDITDIYQLGAVFYELFTGRPPFEGDPAKLLHQILNEQPTPPSEIADVPAALDEVLLTTLASERDQRYDDIVYLRDAFQELFDDWR